MTYTMEDWCIYMAPYGLCLVGLCPEKPNRMHPDLPVITSPVEAIIIEPIRHTVVTRNSMYVLGTYKQYPLTTPMTEADAISAIEDWEAVRKAT